MRVSIDQQLALEKMILALRPEIVRLLMMEAQRRDVKVQELLRAVIVPEWFRTNPHTSIIREARERIPSRTRRPTVNIPQQEPLLEVTTDRGRH